MASLFSDSVNIQNFRAATVTLEVIRPNQVLLSSRIPIKSSLCQVSVWIMKRTWPAFLVIALQLLHKFVLSGNAGNWTGNLLHTRKTALPLLYISSSKKNKCFNCLLGYLGNLNWSHPLNKMQKWVTNIICQRLKQFPYKRCKKYLQYFS